MTHIAREKDLINALFNSSINAANRLDIVAGLAINSKH
jgi:hypothetical protein